MRSSVIISTGRYLPETIIFNEDLTQFPASSLKLIAQKTGVLCRRNAAANQCTSDLAIESGRACLEKIGFSAQQVQGIIVSTASPDRVQPATATRVQDRLGAESAFAFDINSSCSGSTFGICLADSLIRSGKCDNILLIAAEMHSKIVNQKDFATCPYFGDGSGAILFGVGDSSAEGVLHSHLRTDGSKCDVAHVPGGGTMLPFEKMANPGLAFLKMNGRSVYDFAVHRGSEVIGKLVEEAGVSLGDINCFVPHQANVNIIRKIAETIGVPADRFYVNLDAYGNTGSASVLIALDEAISKGVISKGDLVVTVAFGGGLSWGANLIRI